MQIGDNSHDEGTIPCATMQLNLHSPILYNSQNITLSEAVQILEQGILHIAFSKIVGSSLTSAHRLREHLPLLTWKDHKSNNTQQYHTQPLPICNKVPMNFLKCTYIL